MDDEPNDSVQSQQHEETYQSVKDDLDAAYVKKARLKSMVPTREEDAYQLQTRANEETKSKRYSS